jgi:electron transport complex protein RnfE
MNQIRRGIFKENPVFVIMLGLCPALAVSTQVINGVGMGMAILVVLIGSNLVISLMRSIVPSTIRIPVFIVIIASFVTIVDLAMQAWLPSLAEALGIFIPLIVVNCIILGRAEAFASKNPPLPSVMDAVGMATGFMLALVLLASIRELLGNGTITLEILGIGTTIHVPLLEKHKAVIMILPPGAFLTMGLLMGLFNLIRNKTTGSANTYTWRDAHISHKRKDVCYAKPIRRKTP